MAGDYITCPSCQGWPSCETGMICLTCGDDGVIWNEEPDCDGDFDEGFDAGEWNNVVNVGDELHQVLADALSAEPVSR